MECLPGAKLDVSDWRRRMRADKTSENVPRPSAILPSVDQIRHSACKLLERKRLWQETDSRVKYIVMNNSVARVARHKQDFERGLAARDFIGQLAAAHFWHDNIC